MTGAVVVAWVGSTNLGDELVFAALHRKLEARGVRTTAVSLDPAGTRAVHGVDAIGHRSLLDLDRRLRSADAVIFGGGGLVQDETSPFNLPFHLSRVVHARARRRPVAGVGLGALGLVSRLGQQEVRRTLHGVPLSVRDAASASALRTIGLEAEVAADLAVSLPPRSVAPLDRVVVCLRPWSGRRSRRPVALRRAHAIPSWFATKTAAALDRIASSTGLAVHFVAFQVDRDHAVHETVAREMRTPVTFADPTVETVVDEVASGRAVVSVRYHGGVAALLAGRPSVLIGYSAKVPALAEDIGRGAIALPWGPAALDDLPGAVERSLTRAGDVEPALASLRARELGNDAVLDALLESGG